MRTSGSLAATRTALAAVAVALALAGCATGAPVNAASPTSAPTTSAAPSDAPPPAPTQTAPTIDPAPTTPPAPQDQPTVVYTKAVASVALGEQAKVTITVETPNPGVPYGDVELLLDGASYASGTLDEGGHLAVTLPALDPGKHTYQGIFAGNDAYAASQSSVKTIASLTAAQIADAKQQAAAAKNKCPATADACIDLTNNTTWLQQNGVITAGPYPQIAGRAGHRTPTGTFTVQWKDIDHLSKEFDNAPMPYSIFFTTNGIAFHVGSLSTPSHGCIHLSQSAAKVYWNALYPGDVVYVFGSAQY